MASSSRSRGRGPRARGGGGGWGRGRARASGGTRAAAAPDALLAPELNPEFVAMPAADLIAHLNRHRRTESTDDFVDVALVLAARERCLAEAEALLHRGDEVMDSLRDQIREYQRSALELKAQISRAAETETQLRAQIRSLLEELRAAADAKALARHGSDAGGVHSPLMLGAALPTGSTLQADLIAEARAGKRPAKDALSISNEDAVQREEVEVSQDVLRVATGREEVSEEEAEAEAVGEGSSSRRRRRSHDEELPAARATRNKNARRQKAFSFYKMVFNSLKETEGFLQKKVTEETIAKEASKQLYLRCWSHAPYLPSKFAATEEASDDDEED